MKAAFNPGRFQWRRGLSHSVVALTLGVTSILEVEAWELGCRSEAMRTEIVSTYCSALMYWSSWGLQVTLPIRTPVWMSLNCRPRFSPVMVNMVPPCLGPVSGNSWLGRTDDRGHMLSQNNVWRYHSPKAVHHSLSTVRRRKWQFT